MGHEDPMCQGVDHRAAMGVGCTASVPRSLRYIARSVSPQDRPTSSYGLEQRRAPEHLAPGHPTAPRAHRRRDGAARRRRRGRDRLPQGQTSTSRRRSCSSARRSAPSSTRRGCCRRRWTPTTWPRTTSRRSTRTTWPAPRPARARRRHLRRRPPEGRVGHRHDEGRHRQHHRLVELAPSAPRGCPRPGPTPGSTRSSAPRSAARSRSWTTSTARSPACRPRRATAARATACARWPSASRCWPTTGTGGADRHPVRASCRRRRAATPSARSSSACSSASCSASASRSCASRPTAGCTAPTRCRPPSTRRSSRRCRATARSSATCPSPTCRPRWPRRTGCCRRTSATAGATGPHGARHLRAQPGGQDHDELVPRRRRRVGGALGRARRGRPAAPDDRRAVRTSAGLRPGRRSCAAS